MIKIILKSIPRKKSCGTGNIPNPGIFWLFWKSLTMKIEVQVVLGRFYWSLWNIQVYFVRMQTCAVHQIFGILLERVVEILVEKLPCIALVNAVELVVQFGLLGVRGDCFRSTGLCCMVLLSLSYAFKSF